MRDVTDMTMTEAEEHWLDHAWEVVNCSDDHRRGCVSHGATSGSGLDGLDDLCFPGYLGRDDGGLLCVAAVHKSPEKVSDHEVRIGRRYREAHAAWRHERSPAADTAFIEMVRPREVSAAARPELRTARQVLPAGVPDGSSG